MLMLDSGDCFIPSIPDGTLWNLKKKKKLFLSNKEHEITGFSTSEQELYSCIVSDMKKQKDHLFISAYLSLAVK